MLHHRSSASVYILKQEEVSPQYYQGGLVEENQLGLGCVAACGADEEVRAAAQSVDRSRS